VVVDLTLTLTLTATADDSPHVAARHWVRHGHGHDCNGHELFSRGSLDKTKPPCLLAALPWRGHEPPAGPHEQVLADVGRLDDHRAVVVDQDGHVDVSAGEARELVALPEGDLDEVVASAEEIEQPLDLARLEAVAQSVELHGQASNAAEPLRLAERPRPRRCRLGAGLKQPCTRLCEEDA
jgi:hypothetical protein